MRVENEIRIAKFDECDDNFLYCSFEHDILKLIDINLEDKVSNIDIAILIEKVFFAKYLNLTKYVFEAVREMMFYVNKTRCFKK